MGNEAGYGANFEAAYDWIKAEDPSRAVQYEQAGKTGKTDIYCPMYYGYDGCKKYSEDDSMTKPLIQCEYAHAMGNSQGGFKEYWDLVRKYSKFQGGFIWDFVDQSVRWTGKNGKMIYPTAVTLTVLMPATVTSAITVLSAPTVCPIPTCMR